jgi:hypothetical protein
LHFDEIAFFHNRTSAQLLKIHSKMTASFRIKTKADVGWIQVRTGVV